LSREGHLHIFDGVPHQKNCLQQRHAEPRSGRSEKRASAQQRPHTHTHTHCLGWLKRKAVLSLPNKHTQIYTTHLLEISVCFLPRLCFLLPPLRIPSHWIFFSTTDPFKKMVWSRFHRFGHKVFSWGNLLSPGANARLVDTFCAPGTFFRQRRGRSPHSATSGVEPMNRGDGPAGPDGEKLLCAPLHIDIISCLWRRTLLAVSEYLAWFRHGSEPLGPLAKVPLALPCRLEEAEGEDKAEVEEACPTTSTPPSLPRALGQEISSPVRRMQRISMHRMLHRHRPRPRQ